MIKFIIPFLQVDVNEKLKNAPNNAYQTGVIIGSLLPFALLVGLAWFIYWRMKNRKDLDN